MKKWGLGYVVDMDLSKCFDTLDHELIIETINEKISDGKAANHFIKNSVGEDIEGNFSKYP